MSKLTSDYWNTRYKENRTGWNIGHASPALIGYVKKHIPLEAKILIPGVGEGHEIEELWKLGYHQVYGLDFAPLAKGKFVNQYPHIPENRYIISDFFQMEGQYDLILEQTFFCAIIPDLREAYALHMGKLLKKNSGLLAGLLFNFPLEDGPPYGGNIHAYAALFSKYFEILKLEKCKNSIEPRAGKELFFECRNSKRKTQ